MEGFQSLVTAVEELGGKIEKMESTLNQWNAKALESHVLPEEQRRREDIEVLASHVLPAEQRRSEDIPMGFSRTEEYSDKTVVGFEDLLDRKKEEVLFASCRLVQIFNLRDYDTDQESEMGLLDTKRFEAAYERETRSDLNSVNVKNKARKLCNYWQAKISAVVGMDKIPFKPYDEGELEIFKESYGVDLYRMIRKAFREMRVASRTGVSNKPWNYRQGREATLSEIMIRVQSSIRRLRDPRRRAD